jgi:hypothetical protein
VVQLGLLVELEEQLLQASVMLNILVAQVVDQVGEYLVAVAAVQPALEEQVAQVVLLMVTMVVAVVPEQEQHYQV